MASVKNYTNKIIKYNNALDYYINKAREARWDGDDNMVMYYENKVEYYQKKLASLHGESR